MPEVTVTCNYYTPEDLAWALIGLIPQKRIKTVVDISCGNGALLKAARKRYARATLFGVDIVEQNFYKNLTNCSFSCEDALDFIAKCDCSFDLILSNPPFAQTDNIKDVVWKVDELKRKRMECLMFNANLSLMHDNSWLIIILPSTFVIGTTYKKIRKAICDLYGIYGLVSLPEDTFGSHRIKTYALIICGRKDKAHTTVYWSALKNGNTWFLVNKGILSRSTVSEGTWGEYPNDEIKDSDICVFRGTVCSSDFTEEGIAVYHTATKEGKQWKPKVKYALCLRESQLSKIARKGDIIINRIGKAAGYWWVNNSKEYPVSDCVFVLKKFKKCVNILNQISDQGRLNLPLRGVATQYITKGDILRLFNTVKF